MDRRRHQRNGRLGSAGKLRSITSEIIQHPLLSFGGGFFYDFTFPQPPAKHSVPAHHAPEQNTSPPEVKIDQA